MRKLLLLIAFSFTGILYAQKPNNSNSSEILLQLQKLNFLGNVLYIAAHPDDENTRLIAYLSNEMLANTAYLSMTRGDGGQNLIGSEIREGLGIIRTQELLAARRIDGGQQFFTRANDFGYSKTPEETQQVWNRNEVLADIIWTIRKFRPDVIITRFPTDGGGGHGHHTTSAILAQEAFKLAGDKNSFPEQLEYVTTWQPKRLYLNTGRWWNQSITASSPGVITLDVGEYNELLGESYTEMAADSRSQHKSQGFGSTGSRGSNEEFLEYRLGEKAEKSIFDNVNTTWSRVKGAGNIANNITSIIEKYDAKQPSKSLPALLAVRDQILRLEDDFWKYHKLKEIDVLIKRMLGLYVQALANDYSATTGDKVSVSVEMTNRSKVPVTLEMVSYGHLYDTLFSKSVDYNESIKFDSDIIFPESWKISQPYWLVEKGTLGTYKVSDPLMRGKPENDPLLTVSFLVDVAGHKIKFDTPLVYHWNDPVDGESYRPFILIPPAFINIPENVYLFNEGRSKQIALKVIAGKDGINGEAALKAPKGWTVSPSTHNISLATKGQEQVVTFEVTPPSNETVGELKAFIKIAGEIYNNSLQIIDYNHIPIQTLMSEAAAKLVNVNINKLGHKIGYLIGAGDDIPACLSEIGYDVVLLDVNNINQDNISGFDAIVLGVRALNTNERAALFMPVLLEYVKQGGTLLVQYNTTRGLKTENFAPYPLELSRDRVSEEQAEVKILSPKHIVLNQPNEITPSDFDGWVQERGLYFPNQWSNEYEVILSSHDKNETPKNGGLLIAKYGKGYYVYSGYSWFRQLPAGVPGAYKLFVNLLSLGQEKPQ